MEISRAQAQNLEIWRNDPFTRWYLGQIDTERRRIEETMGRGGTVNMNSADQTAMNTSHNFGYVRGLDFATLFEFEEGEEDES